MTDSTTLATPDLAQGRDDRVRFWEHPLAAVVLRRLAMSVPLLLICTALSYILASLAPGDTARSILGLQATPEALERLRTELGLDRPVVEQYWTWALNAFRGDLGQSVLSGAQVTNILNSRLTVTLSLILGSLIVSLIVGSALGMSSAVTGGRVSRVLDAVSLVGISLPAFWAGAILITVFAVEMRLFPATGYQQMAESPTGWLSSLVLPVAALSLGGVAAIAKQTREAMLETLDQEYMRAARANGVGPTSLVLRHAAKNASIRVVTVLGVQIVTLLGGTVVVESVFSLPGLGSLAVSATLGKDLPVIQGVVVYFTVIVVVTNLLVDIAYTWLNPKVRVK